MIRSKIEWLRRWALRWASWVQYTQKRKLGENKLEVIYQGEPMTVQAYLVNGSHLACLEASGRFPEGLLVGIADASNRWEFRKVFVNLFDESKQYRWPDGSRVTVDEIMGF